MTMRLQLDRDTLLSALGRVAPAVATRTTKPILSNVKATLGGGSLTLTATDLEIGIQYSVPLMDADEGSAILPLQRLLAILREAAVGDIGIDADERRCLVTTPTAEYEMPSEAPEDFPELPGFPDGGGIPIPADALSTAIGRTVFAAGKDNTKYAITGVLFEVGAGVNVIATDTKRLALVELLPGLDGKATSHLIPVKALTLLDRQIDGEAGEVQCHFAANEALFKVGAATAYTRLIEGRFPPYRDILPKKATVRVPLVAGTFLSAVKQAAIMVDDESKKVTFDFSGGKVVLEARGAATGKGCVKHALPDFDGSLLVSLDPSYVADFLKVLPKDAPLTLEATDGQRPVLFVADGCRCLVMPLM